MRIIIIVHIIRVHVCYNARSIMMDGSESNSLWKTVIIQEMSAGSGPAHPPVHWDCSVFATVHMWWTCWLQYQIITTVILINNGLATFSFSGSEVYLPSGCVVPKSALMPGCCGAWQKECYAYMLFIHVTVKMITWEQNNFLATQQFFIVITIDNRKNDVDPFKCNN